MLASTGTTAGKKEGASIEAEARNEQDVTAVKVVQGGGENGLHADIQGVLGQKDEGLEEEGYLEEPGEMVASTGVNASTGKVVSVKEHVRDGQDVLG